MSSLVQPSPLDGDPSPEPTAAAWAAQDAELDAEIAALEALGVLTAPAQEEQPDPALDPVGDLPYGLHAWLTDLPDSPLDEHLAATADVRGPKLPQTGCRDRATGGGAGFATDEVADLLPPGPALAGFAEEAHAAGLSRLTDDELAGVIRAGRRLSSWASALELAAVGDLMRRRESQEASGQLHAAEHVDAEIAALLTLTHHGAGRVLDLAISLRRLPLTTRALAAGVIDLPRVTVIADETTGLDDDHATAVEQHILARAEGQTTSQLRAAARRAVFAADPRAARKRQEQAQREARVERWNEQAGTAALAGRDLPPAAVIAADQHISALARGLRAAGLAGTADQLRAQVFLALLSGASISPATVSEPGTVAGAAPATADEPRTTTPTTPATTDEPRIAGRATSGPDAATPAAPVTVTGPGIAARTTTSDPETAAPATPATASDPRTAAPAAPAAANWLRTPAVAGMVNLTMPLSTWLGLLDAPGEVSGFGPLTADDSRHLGTAMAGHPQTRWCVTLTGSDGRPVAHGCARPGHGPPTSEPGQAPSVPRQARPVHACDSPASGLGRPDHSPGPAEHGPGPPAHGPARPAHPCESLDAGPGPPDHGPGPPAHGPARPAHPRESLDDGPGPPDHGPGPADRSPGPAQHDPGRPGWLARIQMQWFESAGCAHRRQSAAYRPPPALQHLIRVRQQACAFPGCRRPASQCDLDHTTPFQRDGLTCECNLAPLCRRHHEAKQAPGWRLEQSRPGVLTWTIPSGRSYTTRPTLYPG